MEEKKKFKNNLTIDLCDGFLRVGKGVVKSLGTPCYISLMINDEKKIRYIGLIIEKRIYIMS